MTTSAKTYRILPDEHRTRVAGKTASAQATLDTRRARRAGTILLALFLACGLCAGLMGAQEDESTARGPLLSKKTMGGSRRAFSGKIETLDLKRKILTVSTVEGAATEIFPVKKGTSVSGAKGKKLKLADLLPGTNVIVYYDYRDGRRTVNEIMVLAVSPSKDEKKKSPPPS